MNLPENVPELADVCGKDDVSIKDNGLLHPSGQDLSQGQLQQSINTYTSQPNQDPGKQCCGSVYLIYGSGSSPFCNIRIRIRLVIRIQIQVIL